MSLFRAALALLLLAGPLAATAATEPPCCELDAPTETTGPTPLPAGVGLTADQPYGSSELQRFDVYRRPGLTGAPLLILVHGGAWRTGDKSARAVVENKLAAWATKGFVVVSVNYRLLPRNGLSAQAADLAQAVAAVQKRATEWGADRGLTLLMGHSAGAHLAALLSAAPDLLQAVDATLPRGTVLLDSAALDVPALMNERHLRLYDQAFGSNPVHWRELSPLHTLAAQGPNILAICSSRRSDACPQAEAFAKAAEPLGRSVRVLPQDLTHRAINEQLGLDSPYTRAVERFMAELDPRIAERLGTRAAAR